jgi:hypothetical protein
MSIFFIAQTPRAGEKNHCLVVPCHLPVCEREIFARINAAIYQPIGKDYMAVSQVVEQAASTRQGHEILVLVGLNVNKLSSQQRDEVCLKLKHYLSEFETLVTKQIDWEHENDHLLVCRPELEQWGQDRFLNRLPKKSNRKIKKWFKRKKNECDKQPLKYWLHKILIILIILFAIMSLFKNVYFSKNTLDFNYSFRKFK